MLGSYMIYIYTSNLFFLFPTLATPIINPNINPNITQFRKNHPSLNFFWMKPLMMQAPKVTTPLNFFWEAKYAKESTDKVLTLPGASKPVEAGDFWTGWNWMGPGGQDSIIDVTKSLAKLLGVKVSRTKPEKHTAYIRYRWGFGSIWMGYLKFKCLVTMGWWSHGGSDDTRWCWQRTKACMDRWGWKKKTWQWDNGMVGICLYFFKMKFWKMEIFMKME